MFEQYYGFSARPFQLTPDPAFWFESATHRKAMSYLGYGLAQGEGFIVITGEIGAGKTTLVGHLMERIDARRLTAVKLVSTRVDGDAMLRLAAQGFGIEAATADKAALLQHIEAFLHAEARAGRRALLIVDEAQNLSATALEELRMLSNFQLGGQPLLQIFLLGQPEFRDLVQRAPDLEQLRQRVIASHHLEPMQADEVGPYIEHRLRHVGWIGNPRFTPDAYALLAQASARIPRRLNGLVSRALLLGAIDRLDVIDAQVIAAVVADSGEEGEVPSPVQASDQLASAPARPAPVIQPAELEACPPALASLRADLEAFAGSRSPAEPREAAAPPALAALGERLEALERRADEQDATLHRILAKLVEWAERDADQGPFANRAA